MANRIGRRTLFAAGLAVAAVAEAAQAQLAPQPPRALPLPEIIPLWPMALPEPTPPSLIEHRDGGLVGVRTPRLEIFHPPAAINRKRAVMVIPSGGYRRLVLDNEAYGMAHYLISRGVTACVLIYRLPADKWVSGPLAPLQDAQRAMRIVRSRAEGWGLDSEHIGLVGFSAGGHLAGMLATSHAKPLYPARDRADALSARPAYAGLIYPVISMAARLNHGLTRHNLVGDKPSAAKMAAWSVNKHVGPDMPPTFLVHAADDPVVPAENSQLMFSALQAARIRSELHIFEVGGHGFGMVATSTAAIWPELFTRWTHDH